MAQSDEKAVAELRQGEVKMADGVLPRSQMSQFMQRARPEQLARDIITAELRRGQAASNAEIKEDFGVIDRAFDALDVQRRTQNSPTGDSPILPVSPSSSEASSVFSPPPNRVSIAPQGGSANSPGVNHPIGTPVAASPPAYSMPSTPAGQGWQFGTPVPSAQRVAPETPEYWPRVAPLFNQLVVDTPPRTPAQVRDQLRRDEPFFAQLRQDQQFFQQDTPARVAVLQQIFDGAAQQVQQAPDTPLRQGSNSPPGVSVQSPITPMPSPNQAERAMMETPGTIARDLRIPLGGLTTQPEPLTYGNRMAMEMQMDEAYDHSSTDREYDVMAAQERDQGDPTFRERFFGYGTAALLGAAVVRMTQEATRVRPQY